MQKVSQIRDFLARQLLERQLDEATRAALYREDSEVNLHRGRTWGWSLVVLQSLLFWMARSVQARSPLTQAWRHDLLCIYGCLMAGYVVMFGSALANRGPARWLARHHGPVLGAYMLVCHALIAINAQRNTGAVTAYVGLLVVMPFSTRVRTRWFVGFTTVTSTLAWVGIGLVQPSLAIRSAARINVVSFTLASMAIAHLQRVGVVQAFVLRRALADMNTQLAAKVEIQTREIRRFALRLEETLEAERRRLAGELHDDLGQELTALRLDAEAMQSYTVEERQTRSLTRMAGSIARAHAEVRSILESLRPRVLDEEGLEKAVAWLVANVRERHGRACEFDVHLLREPHPRVALTVFRVVQESLTNVLRHAGTASVSVRLHQHGDELLLEISDNGTDRAPEGLTAGRGLAGMHERALSVGGTLTVEPGAVSGTRVLACLPMEPRQSVATPMVPQV